jgi:hypothetical protein
LSDVTKRSYPVARISRQVFRAIKRKTRSLGQGVSREEQGRQTPGSPPRVFQRGGVEMGCSAGRMQRQFHHGLLRLVHKNPESVW